MSYVYHAYAISYPDSRRRHRHITVVYTFFVCAFFLVFELAVRAAARRDERPHVQQERRPLREHLHPQARLAHVTAAVGFGCRKKQRQKVEIRISLPLMNQQKKVGGMARKKKIGSVAGRRTLRFSDLCIYASDGTGKG